ncbi:MAG TPA: pectin acetylesterase-family hydrolase [Polyangiaceae bacterium]|jgi:hypothetical protein|nr:pectin acetylesterase-family hydrolase [Polyangiaceae bacterium]
MRITSLLGCQVGPLAVFAALAACGSSNSETPGKDAGPAVPEAGADALATVEAGADGGVSGPFATSTLTPETWSWVPVGGAICRDGSPTGFGVSVGSATDKVMIYLEGGGACFNALTCGMNPAKYGESDFTSDFVGATAPHANLGIFNRGFAANPVKDWTFIYVPYCTGDVHAGNATDQTVTGVTGKQQFVGYVNVGLDLQRIVPSFPGVTKVLLTGISAGGFGAASDYVQVAQAFGSVPVYEIDDSGPPMPDPYNPKCLLTEQVNLWGFDKTILKDCGSDCSDLGTFPIDFAKHVGKTYPKVPFGLIESTDDGVITDFFGFGAENCTATLPAQVTAATFTAGLTAVQTDLQGYPNFGSFIFGEPGAANSTQHTSLGGDSTFQTEDTSAVDTLLTTADGGASPEAGAVDAGASAADGGSARIKLVDWVTQLLGGTTSNVGP